MRLLLVATAVAAVSLAACGKKEEARRAAPSVEVTPDGYSVTTRDGTATVVTGSAASAVRPPAFAPLYPGARVETSIAGMGDGEATGGTAVFKVAATPEQILDFYRAKAKAAGFETQMDANMGPARMFAASDEASNRGVQVIVSPAGAEASVQLIWATPKD